MTKYFIAALLFLFCLTTMQAQNTTGFVRDYSILNKKFYYRPVKDFSYIDGAFRMYITPFYLPDNEGNLKLRYLQVKVNCGKHIQDRLRIALENGRALTFEKLNLPANETNNVFAVTGSDDYWLNEAQIIAMRYFNDAEYETEGKVIPVGDGMYFYNAARKACGLSIYDIPDYDTLVAAIHTDVFGYPYPKKSGEQKLGFAANPQALPWVNATPEETAQFTVTKRGLSNGDIDVQSKTDNKVSVSKTVLACEVVYYAFSWNINLPLDRKKKESWEHVDLYHPDLGTDNLGHPFVETVGVNLWLFKAEMPCEGLVFTLETASAKFDVTNYTCDPKYKNSYKLKLGPQFDMEIFRNLKRFTITSKTDAAINYSYTIQDNKLATIITALRVLGAAE
jgi:hypothetical protein